MQVQGDRTAVKYYQPRQKDVRVGEDLYRFFVKANIAMAWVKNEHVDQVLSVRGGCCGQKKPGVFRLANEDDVRRWTNNGGR